MSKQPKAPSKGWTPMPLGLAEETLSKGVHFSSKPVNTNASASGVRLAHDDRPDLPFVAYSTLNVNRRVTTYIVGGAPKAAPFNQATAVIEGTVDEQYAGCSPEQRQQVLRESKILDEGYVLGGDLIDPRLRQIISSTPGAIDVALTPLHSPPFSAELQRRVKAEKEAHPGAWTRKVAVLGIGGSNSQNVGRNIYPMTRPLVFEAPRESKALRKALAIHHQGVPLESLLPADLVTKLIEWRKATRTIGGALRSTMETRREEVEQIQSIARVALHRAEAIGAEIDPYLEQLGARCAPDVDPVIAGAIDPDLRGRAWAKRFASRLIRAIEDFKVDGNSPSLSHVGDLDVLADAIEKIGAQS